MGHKDEKFALDDDALFKELLETDRSLAAGLRKRLETELLEVALNNPGDLSRDIHIFLSHSRDGLINSKSFLEMVELLSTAHHAAIKDPERPAQQAFEPHEKHDPPASIEKLLYLTLPRRDREALLGDLHEVYTQEVVPKFGIAYARRWYAVHAAGGMLRVWWANARKYALVTAFGKMVDWLFQRFS